MEEVDDIILDDDDDIIYDNVDNLPKRKRKRRKKFFLQKDVDELRNKLHANKYFMEEITPRLVRCKCGKEIRCLIGDSWKIFDFFSQKHITNTLATILG